MSIGQKQTLVFIQCYIFSNLHGFVLFFLKQIQLKDLLRTGNVKSSDLKGGSLMELMKLKPPPNITTPVATATGTGQLVLFLGADLCLRCKMEGNKYLYMHHTMPHENRYIKYWKKLYYMLTN